MKKILVIDDQDWLREMINLALSQHGFMDLEADTGRRGVELARQEIPDLILCDVHMELEDAGYLALASLRADPLTASIPFILMTGLADPAGMRHGMELGADDYLPKPFTIDALYAAVDVRLKKLDAMRMEAERKLSDLRENISLMLPHELRTPLNGILAYGEILTTEARSLQPAEIAEMGQVIYQSARQLERLVENFLIHAQLETCASDPLKLKNLLDQNTANAKDLVEQRALTQARLAARPGDLSLHLTPAPVPMLEDYFGKIVDELLQNAFKFSLPGSPVRVSWGRSPAGVALTVTDQGHGLSADQISRIGAYMQFDRKLHEQEGLGLGLTICKRLLEMHGGSLEFRSRPGEGTTVTAQWPELDIRK